MHVIDIVQKFKNLTLNTLEVLSPVHWILGQPSHALGKLWLKTNLLSNIEQPLLLKKTSINSIPFWNQYTESILINNKIYYAKNIVLDVILEFVQPSFNFHNCKKKIAENIVLSLIFLLKICPKSSILLTPPLMLIVIEISILGL